MGKLFLVVAAVLGLGVLEPAAAQGTAGTARQRTACERDSHRFCAAAEPDAIAVEKCLREHMGALSKACQRQFRARR
ncbi:hypothetical protein WOC76_03370 [Methylocystis sp. IM3]|uniref:hypothetical protein n=1 Tax=unclassified Methylocystis TaxID=2625913 RepID=UPI0030F788F9